ncbi:protein kinase domain-containing protein [Sorangium sp. So ce131]|uniref:protein kinase domain-containing protein n=1 Tax=Sorangium sp. So ce131 TaxID=3133282 RepID=UPI003F5FD20D
MPAPLNVFYSYSSEDSALFRRLESHIIGLEREGLIRGWHAGLVGAGEDGRAAAAEHLDNADIILLLVTAEYLASRACAREAERALERRRAAGARVVPVLVRACDWSGAPFRALSPLPSNQVPVTSWSNPDEAWTDVARGLRTLLSRAIPTEPEPNYPDAHTRVLSEQIARVRARKAALREHGADTSALDREIADLRRQLREGGLREGDTLGDERYLLLNRLGHGGFAVVWNAYDRVRKERVAIKVLHSHLAGDTLRRERFFRGAQKMAELVHKSIVRVIETRGEEGGHHYFVMELVEGEDLRQAVLKQALGREAIIPIVLQVADALGHAHAKGMIHRDVKPANILIGKTGIPKLTDFDLVADADTTGGTRTGVLGSVIYTAPEVLEKPQDADPRSDVYSLAVTAAFALHGGDLPLTAVARVGRYIDKMDCDEPIKRVLKIAAALDKNERYKDAASLYRALKQAMEPAAAQGGVSRPCGPHATINTTRSVDAGRTSGEDALAGWAGVYEYIEGMPAFVWCHSVEIACSQGGDYIARVEESGYQSCARFVGAVRLIGPDRVRIEFVGYGEGSISHPTLERGASLLELERDADGSVDFIWGALKPSIPPPLSYVGSPSSDFLADREIGRRLRYLLEDDYERLVDCDHFVEPIGRDGPWLVLGGQCHHRAGERRYYALYDMKSDKMHLLLYDGTEHRIDVWSESWCTLPSQLSVHLENINVESKLPVNWHR